MSFSYTSDKDGFPDIGVQDSKYLPLPANMSAKVQLLSITSKKLLLMKSNDNVAKMGRNQCQFSHFVFLQNSKEDTFYFNMFSLLTDSHLFPNVRLFDNLTNMC